MDEFLTDREQEERLRNWWRDNWRWILAGIVIGVGLLIGWNQYREHKVTRSEDAARQYTELQAALGKNDHARATALLGELSQEHGKSPYPDQARLQLAKIHVEQGRFEEAVPLLQTVANESQDKELAELARLRLARVLLQTGKHDEALAAIKVADNSAYEPLAHEVRGDIHFARGQTNEARAEYAAALEGDDATLDRTLLELKLQQVGGNTPAPAPPGTASAKAAP